MKVVVINLRVRSYSILFLNCILRGGIFGMALYCTALLFPSLLDVQEVPSSSFNLFASGNSQILQCGSWCSTKINVVAYEKTSHAFFSTSAHNLKGISIIYIQRGFNLCALVRNESSLVGEVLDVVSVPCRFCQLL